MTKKHEAKAVLIIEDEADIRNFACRVLELEGYRVLQTDDGDKGIGIAIENPVALVLLDLRLSGRDGWSVLGEMKGKPALSAIPVVALTATAGVQQRERALSMGAAAYLEKPLSAARLRETIARILQQEKKR